MSKQFYLETFGCQMNVVDSERIVVLLEEIGYRQTDRVEDADLILLNTCSVRDKAERKVIGHLGRFKPLKENNPGLIVAVGGCVAQQEGASFLEKIPHLDLVFGTHNIHKLPELVRRVEEKRERCHEVEFLDRETRLRLFPQRSGSESVTRFVTVMQGCDNFCSYCIVPHVRGREVSRPSGEILEEIRQLAAAGVREVTLIGQNVNSYGARDAGEKSFAELLRAVHRVDGIERIRFTTSHPKDLSDQLIDCFGECGKLAHHLHLPLQAGSDRVLRTMNRGYTVADYLGKVERLKAVCPDIRLTTDLIVGFPGETEEDFLGTLQLVETLRYSDAYTFLYSPRPGTAAAELPDDTPRAVRQERFERLLKLQNRISEEAWQGDVGKTLEVLVEGTSRQGEGQLFGRSSWNRIVNFSGPTELVGRMVKVRVTRSLRNSQLGERVD
ncbi:tRNA (N6-isopentenyl adenosine(37)-C2)-methylthiotransferase MiaB [Geothermobacter hydrogeniphilus]|uniref:tRNA-2-methylthio-N(6)-dimethylallyladenosine synthase n=1 Tax=Geothermobacter hydrogeniphilus TaxID=1969733 RepID=A0A2K2HC43_9BACT|nr:tRNA (N6-isopentenyl adenosine(37)-C2)-methylthiotransferase MiaB [Geothermobacter hydrogeniphilus]PNU20878.1 tRNA (N6-isopentenyl adenosine(37)-C2)-methylthiotransferase MiaB [Geothermobacter hydrogeniphilus]